jgi:hypothetical protein
VFHGRFSIYGLLRSGPERVLIIITPFFSARRWAGIAAQQNVETKIILCGVAPTRPVPALPPMPVAERDPRRTRLAKVIVSTRGLKDAFIPLV